MYKFFSWCIWASPHFLGGRRDSFCLQPTNHTRTSPSSSPPQMHLATRSNLPRLRSNFSVASPRWLSKSSMAFPEGKWNHLPNLHFQKQISKLTMKIAMEPWKMTYKSSSKWLTPLKMNGWNPKNHPIHCKPENHLKQISSFRGSIFLGYFRGCTWQ